MPERQQSLSVTSNFDLLDFVHYEVLADPDPGGRLEQIPPFNDTLVLAEPCQPQVSTIIFNANQKIDADSQKHLERVDRVQQIWDLTLKIERNNGKILSYNPVLDRANFERLIEEGATEKQIEDLKLDLVRGMEKNLREKFHAPRSTIRYFLDEHGIAYSENDFTQEPADVIFQRGALYRIKQGSREPDRELSTVEGGIKARKELADSEAPLHSKRIIVSPPSEIEGTAYTDNFVDIYEKDYDPQTDRVIIVMTRFASSLNNDEYREKLSSLQPDYFKGETANFDSLCLKKPIAGDQREAHVIFNQEFRGQKGSTSENDIQLILKECSSLIQYYKEVICSNIFDPKEVALVFNAILNKADIIKDAYELGSKFVTVIMDAPKEAFFLGRHLVKDVFSGCGLSGGFSLGEIFGASIRGITSSISSFVSGALNGLKTLIGGIFGKSEWYCVRCGACGEYINCVVKPGERCPRSSCGAVRQCA